MSAGCPQSYGWSWESGRIWDASSNRTTFSIWLSLFIRKGLIKRDKMLQVGKKTRLKGSVLLENCTKWECAVVLTWSVWPFPSALICKRFHLLVLWGLINTMHEMFSPSWDTCFLSRLAGTQEDSGGLRHGPGLPAVPGPAGLHARAHLPRWECPGVLPGPSSGGPAQHDQRVSVSLCWKTEHTVCRWARTQLSSVLGSMLCGQSRTIGTCAIGLNLDSGIGIYGSVHWLVGPAMTDWNISTKISWITVEAGTDLHVPM